MNVIAPNSADALLFDLGQVVIEIDFDLAFARWAEYAGQPIDTVKSKFTSDSIYERHERGEIDASAYFASLRNSLGIDISDPQFVEGWNSIYVREIPGIAELLRRAKEKLPLYAFTNTNFTRQQAWSQMYAEVLSQFETVFVSSELGKRKPEPEGFQAISEAIGVPLPRIVLFDDLLENVEGARAVGMQAVQVTSLADITSSLQEILD